MAGWCGFRRGARAAWEMAEVGGRPLGIELYGDDFLVCNADLGLQVVSPGGAVKTLVESFEGNRLLFTNNATVASDGTIYFTDTSTRWTIHEYVTDMLEGRSTGRQFRRDPNGDLTVVIDGLAFANGVALGGGRVRPVCRRDSPVPDQSSPPEGSRHREDGGSSSATFRAFPTT